MTEQDFEDRLQNRDLSLFARIESQSTGNDKQSLLACQSAVRKLLPEYVYLEIGSHLGGSIQSFLPDNRCAKIYSIDKRPVVLPDERGINYVYKQNSTARMLDNLKAIGAIDKIVCFDSDAADINTSEIEPRPNFCFIDGEHTDRAAWNDFRFCLKIIGDNGLLLFHDSWIIYNALHRIIEYLQSEKRQLKAYNLPDIMFAIEIGDFPVHRDQGIFNSLLDNHVGYLASLRHNDYYRRFANKPILRQMRRLHTWIGRARAGE